MINDGGQAFPGCVYNLSQYGSEQVGEHTFRVPGMSLRDWFAGMAMQGILATGEWDKFPEIGSGSIVAAANRRIAKMSLELADAMLAARVQSKPEENP